MQLQKYITVDLGRETKIHLPLPQQTADFQSQDSVDHNHCACAASSAQLPLRTDLNPTIEIPIIWAGPPPSFGQNPKEWQHFFRETVPN